MLLKGKVAFITGGGRGIGRGISLTFAQHGAQVVVADIDRASGEATVQELTQAGYEALYYYLDVTNPDMVKRGLEVCLQRFGKVDILVANAGINHNGPVVAMDLAEWQHVIAVNLTGAFICAKVFAAHMIEQGYGGRILFTSSQAGKRGEAGAAAYAASKFGMIGLLQCLALELAPYGINVNGVCPGIIQTDMIDWLIATIAEEKGTTPELMRQQFISTIPVKRAGDPVDVANAFVFLASSLADYVTGETINVDGGQLSG